MQLIPGPLFSQEGLGPRLDYICQLWIVGILCTYTKSTAPLDHPTSLDYPAPLHQGSVRIQE